MSHPSPRVLYVQRGGARAGYYRCILPAMYGKQDWAAVDGEPPSLRLVSAWVNQTTMEPNFLDYDVVVLQQVRGPRWRDLIKKVRGQGVKVLYEIDDYVHGIRKSPDHDFSKFYEKHQLKEMEICMRSCDGMVVSTEFLADKYRYLARDRPIYVCHNGLDLGRYRLTKPPRGAIGGRETVTILWAGATGHYTAVLPWIAAVREVMRRHPHVTFASVGQSFADLLRDEFPDRVIVVPFGTLESYPAAMMLGDVAIAPAGDSDWYRSKSDLRAQEAAALGIPIVADKHYLTAVDDQETGLIVRDQGVVSALIRLVCDDDLRVAMGERAREKARTVFNMEHRVNQWVDMIEEVCSTR